MNKEIEDYWNWRSETYHSELIDNIDVEIRLWKKIFSEIIPAGVKIRALEIATGPGIIAIALASLGHSVTAVDLSEEMLKKAKANAGKYDLDINFLHGNAEDLPFKDGMFNFVISKYLLWTLPHPDIFIDECRRVLTDGGIFAAIDNNWDNDKDVGTGSETYFQKCYYDIKKELPLYKNNTAERIAGIVKEHGFSEVSWELLTDYDKFVKKYATDEYSYPQPPYMVTAEKLC